ncbi:hypothetical protein I5E68_09910 [Novosphingobium sp. YJ-S2-02]|uniref:VWA domain-containing protein n=1 Tax=Novosphingobium aureum TaxID=2792964 RepID=A0A931MLB2_9SPHN|nr:hypothetical protein [Novosphingobium aureum]MBH0113260.1 hypothetical protein [Novosphingobium aureum]
MIVFLREAGERPVAAHVLAISGHTLTLAAPLDREWDAGSAVIAGSVGFLGAEISGTAPSDDVLAATFDFSVEPGSEPRRARALCIAIGMSPTMTGARRTAAFSAIATALDQVAARIETGARIDLCLVTYNTDASSIVRRKASRTDVEDMVDWLSSQPGIGSLDFDAAFAAAQTFFDAGPGAGVDKALILLSDTLPLSGSDDAAAERLSAMVDVRSHAINIALDDFTAASKVDNTPVDTIPIVPSGDTEALSQTITRALGRSMCARAAIRFAGREVCMFRPNWRSAAAVRFGWSAEFVDFNHGTRDYAFPIRFPSGTRRMLISLGSREEIEDFFDFLDRLRGRQGEFLLPSGETDLVAAESVTIGSSSLLVEGSGAFRDYAQSTVYTALCLTLTDGTVRYASITGIAQDGQNSRITLSQPWQGSIALSAIVRISWMPVCRLGSDLARIDFLTDTVAETELAIMPLETEDVAA